ncbi:hypothetical protein Tco_0354356 [Tanacetum coccineum]
MATIAMTSKALRELSDSLDGLRKWSLCLALDDALTWWNAHVKTTTPEAAHAMTWATLKKMMTDKYYPRLRLRCGILRSRAPMWWPIVDDFSN